MIQLEDLIALTKEVEIQDSIDWGMLNIDEEDALRLIAIDVLETYKSYSADANREIILLSTVTKLVLENFVLQLKLQGK